MNTNVDQKQQEAMKEQAKRMQEMMEEDGATCLLEVGVGEALADGKPLKK